MVSFVLSLYPAFLRVAVSIPHIAGTTKAEATLVEMKTLSDSGAPTRPDFITYSTLIYGWAHHGYPERANAVLRLMYDDFKQGNENAKPDLQCFNTVLKAFTKSKDEMLKRRRHSVCLWRVCVGDKGNFHDLVC